MSYDDDYYYYDTDHRYASNQLHSTPMARGYSGGSVSSNYTASTSMSSPRCHSDAYSPISPTISESPCEGWTRPRFNNSHSYVVDQNQNYTTATSSSRDDWLPYYNFIVDLEPGQEPYWRLKPEYSQTRLPRIRPADSTPRSARGDNKLICLFPGCNSAFARKADLERHHDQMHTPNDKKQSYRCDRKKCPRSKPFFRLDHFREHYRDYHKEDLTRRNATVKEDKEWWKGREISSKWWRCTHCLTRVCIADHGFECSHCNKGLEPERKRARGY